MLVYDKFFHQDLHFHPLPSTDRIVESETVELAGCPCCQAGAGGVGPPPRPPPGGAAGVGS